MNGPEIWQLVVGLQGSAHGIYKEYFLTPAFSGFLSISGFIFAMHSFVITKMKEGVYDTKHYEETLQKAANRHMKSVPRYGTLKELHFKLMACVYICLSAAASQLVLGYIPWAWMVSAALCLIAIWILLRAISAMKANMKYLFDTLDKVLITPSAPQ